MYKVKENLPRYLTRDEITRLCTVTQETHLYPIIVTAIYAGLRYEELFNLRWEDIDKDLNTIRILNREQGFTTKNSKFRVIPLHPELKSLLSQFWRSGGYCFDKVNFRTHWDRALERAGIKVKFHALRHTFGAYSALNGVPIPVLKEWMGHQHIKTTMIYARLRPESCFNYIDRLNFGHSLGHSHALEQPSELS